MKLPAAAIVIALAVLNAISFSLMGYDKQCAKKKKQRVPERTLFLSAALLGALGGCLGMFLFRHKTRHWYFRVFFPLMLLVQAGAIAWALAAGVIRF